MIKIYAFLAAFTVQILVMSIMYPAWFIRYVRVRTTRLPVERLAQLYPGVDVGRAQERFLKQYRAVNAGIAVLGLLLLAWLFNYMLRPEWSDRPVELLVTGYFLAQLLPIGLIAWLGVRFNMKHKHALREAKRKASLQRRGLFDFVSPFAVVFAVLSYFLFVAFVIYIQQDPFPGFAGYVSIGVVTLAYAFQAIFVYMMLYGRRKNPLEAHADRLHTIGLATKSSVYSCIAIVVYVSLNFALRLLDLQRWEPFALSAFFVVCALLISMGVMAPPREPEEHEHGSVVL
jgi:hypothetical protein